MSQNGDEMNIYIKHTIVHELRKNVNSAPEIILRNSVIQTTSKVERLFSELFQLYRRYSTKGLGAFDRDTNTYPFSKDLSDFLLLPSDQSFLTFTRKAMGHLKSRISEANLATGGYILFFLCGEQEDDNKIYLFITLLRQTKGCVITKNLEIDDTEHLDIGNLHIGCQINIFDWINDCTKPYITFIKGSSSKTTPDYFLRAIGCTEYTNAKAQTQEFIRALGDYAKQYNFTHEQKRKMNQRVHRHCTDVQQINLHSISEVIDPEHPERFSDFVNSKSYIFSEGFGPDKRVLKALKEFSAKGEGIKLCCPAEMIGERIFFTNEQGTPRIIIKNPPESMINAFHAEEE